MEVFEHVLPVSVSTNGVTVWVNSSTVLLGRFGMMGVDVHSADPKAGVHCLHCTHGRTNKSDWGVFKLAMLTYHGVVVDDEYMPERLRHARTVEGLFS